MKMNYDSYVICVQVDGEEKYVYKDHAFVGTLEIAKHFGDRKTAVRYMKKYGYEKFNPTVVKILGKEEYPIYY